MNYMKTIQIIIFFLIVVNINSQSQDIPYGVNEKACRYCNVGDANIYYEVYGEGKPIVLLHGGFNYIDGFKKYIPVLSQKFKVIAVATRGYGKSEMGTRKYSYNLLAEDVKKVIEKECQEKAIIIGSSDGSMIAYVTASKYSEVVSKVVVMGGSLGTSGYSKDGLEWLKNFSSEEFEHYRPDFKKIVPQPERWDEFIENLRLMWSTEYILQFDDLKKIKCPMLLLYGDRDLYCTMDRIAKIYLSLPHAQLAVIPNSTHTDVSFRNTKILEEYILPFIDNP
jgi:pimeloyl-ACP methyl ester carboxylesterase